jgi:hypothetical protein
MLHVIEQLRMNTSDLRIVYLFPFLFLYIYNGTICLKLLQVGCNFVRTGQGREWNIMKYQAQQRNGLLGRTI